MNSLAQTFNQHAFVLWLVAVLILVGVGIWLSVQHRRWRRLEARFDSLFGEISGQNTAQMLAEYLGTVRSTAAAMNRLRDEHEEIVRLMPTVVRHLGLVRFSPFHDTGGDQSFALAIIDGKGDGVIVTGLHSRTDSRLYAKPVEGWSSAYSLSPEEREAMGRALGAAKEHART